MKIAIAGKGGVGKTTLCGGLARTFAARGWRVLAVDADPDANLASMLPLEQAAPAVPLAGRRDLVDALSGKDADLPEGMILLNPDVTGILPEFQVPWGGGNGLIVLGWHKAGGQGCYCAENAVLRRVLQTVLAGPRDAVLVDSEAGLEHLSRGTARAVDAVLAVVEPGSRAVETAYAIRRLASDLGVPHVFPVLCGFRDQAEVEVVNRFLCGWPLLAALPFDEEIRGADLQGRPPRLEGAWAETLGHLVDTLIALPRRCEA